MSSRGLKYAHEYEGGVAPGQTYLPERLKGRRYYIPKAIGREKELDRHHETDQGP